MPIDPAEADRNRVLGALVAYLRGVLTINTVYGAVKSASFRNEALEAILSRAETGTKDVGVTLRKDLMETLRDGLKERGFLA